MSYQKREAGKRQYREKEDIDGGNSMGKTAIMKIMERASGHEVQVGDRVWCNVDLASARDFGGANCVLEFEEQMGKEAKVWDPDKVAYTFDLQAPAHTEKVANNQKIIREFAKRQGIKNVFDVNNGIGQHVMLEAGLVKPGDVIKLKDIDERSAMIKHLRQYEIGSVFHYIPLHTSPAGQRFGRFFGDDVFTTRESERLLRLPLYYGLKENQVEFICEKVKEFFR